MRILTWNVNGIRACIKKNFLQWFNSEKIDILCLQEIKADLTDIPEEVKNLKGFDSFFYPAKKKGYSGVGIISSKKMIPLNVTRGLGIEKFDDDGRTLILEYETFILISAYIPNGRPDHSRVDFKLEYSYALESKALEFAKTLKKPLIIAGDFNTAHTEIDLSRPRENQNTTGFLPKERDFIDHFIKAGLLDIFRLQHPQEKDFYTWWSYRTFARKRNVGWRIDYLFVSESLKNNIKSSFILSQVEGSDHCPLGIELRF